MKTLTHHKVEKVISIHKNGSIYRTDSPESICIFTQNHIYKIDFSEILYLQANGNYCSFYLKDNTHIIASKTMKHYEQFLDNRLFIKPHQSYIINWSEVKKLDLRNNTIITKDESAFPLSRSRKPIIIQAFKNNIGVIN